MQFFVYSEIENCFTLFIHEQNSPVFYILFNLAKHKTKRPKEQLQKYVKGLHYLCNFMPFCALILH